MLAGVWPLACFTSEPLPQVPIFRSWDRQISPEVLAILLRLYAPAFPLLLATEPHMTVPAWNAASCIVSAVSPRDSDAEAAYQCITAVLNVSEGKSMYHCCFYERASLAKPMYLPPAAPPTQADPGHLGYVFTSENTVALPWRLRRLPAGRLGVAGRMREVPGVADHLSNCEGEAGVASLESPWRLGNATQRLAPRLRSIMARNAEAADRAQPSCQRNDILYIPGPLSRDAGRVLTAMRNHGVGHLASMRALRGALSLESEQYELRTVFFGVDSSVSGSNATGAASEAISPVWSRLSQDAAATIDAASPVEFSVSLTII